MDWKTREKSFSEFLDEQKQAKLLVRFVFSQDFSSVESFAVILLVAEKEEFKEVVRYDASRFESVNVHEFFWKSPRKRFLDKEVSWDTVEECMGIIRKNRRDYFIRFQER